MWVDTYLSLYYYFFTFDFFSLGYWQFFSSEKPRVAYTLVLRPPKIILSICVIYPPPPPFFYQKPNTFKPYIFQTAGMFLLVRPFPAITVGFVTSCKWSDLWHHVRFETLIPGKAISLTLWKICTPLPPLWELSQKQIKILIFGGLILNDRYRKTCELN